MNPKLHLEGLPESQKLLWDQPAQQPWLEPFYLAGSTALALHLEHRQSIDFDFFTSIFPFSLSKLFEQYLLKYGEPLNNHYHLLKSLVYFKDAEAQPMSVMLVDMSREIVKYDLIAEVKKFR